MNRKLMRRSIFFALAVVLSIITLCCLLPKIDHANHKPSCSSCDPQSVCMNTSFLGSSILDVTCVKTPGKAPIVDIMLPFSSNSPVFCTHGSGIGTHSWPNAYWALDLATPYHADKATIYASAKGIAYVSTQNCKEPPGYPARANTSTCGEGWGNWVKIYHGKGYYTFYAHLTSILVKNGMSVRAGQPIGIEGWTGNAGYRHLHWSVQKLPGKTEQEWKRQISTYVGDSVPFDFTAKFNHQMKKIDVKTLRCENTHIKQSKYPTFYGAFER